MDLDPFVPVGITADTMRMLDVFLLHCLTTPGLLDSPEEVVALADNQHRVAARGREPGLKLCRQGQSIALVDWAGEILRQCVPIAERLDRIGGGDRHASVLAQAIAHLDAPDHLPSARALDAMRRDFGQSHTAFVLAQSIAARAHLAALPLDEEAQARLAEMSAQSVADQMHLEAEPSVPFETWRQAYLAPERLEA